MSNSWLRKVVKVLFHPSIVPFAIGHSKEETIFRLRELESLRITPHGPFHNDSILQQFLISIMDYFQISYFFETGTFRGDSLIWLANKVPSIRAISCENDEFFYNRVVHRLSKLDMQSRVELIYGSSPLAIGQSFEKGLLLEPALFWLDAHWNDYWPLLDELDQIFKLFKRSIVVIDDFKVPNNTLFEYDSYDGFENSLDYIRPSLIRRPTNSELDFLFPNYANSVLGMANNVTPRGYVAIFSGFRESLQQFETRFATLYANFTHAPLTNTGVGNFKTAEICSGNADPKLTNINSS